MDSPYSKEQWRHSSRSMSDLSIFEEFFFRFPNAVLCYQRPKPKTVSATRFFYCAEGYPLKVSRDKDKDEMSPPKIGLCADCRFMRKIQSDRGSTFYLCELSATDLSYAKYPRLPVLQCKGYEARSLETESRREGRRDDRRA